MICPKCKNKIDYGLKNCPCCNHNISFTAKVRTDEEIQISEEINKGKNALSKVFIISAIVGVISLLIIFGIVSISRLFNIFRILKIIDTILTVVQIIGVVGFIIFLILLFKNNQAKIIKVSGIIFLILIIFPFFIKPIIKIDDDMSMKDYTKAEYIKIGAEKIPSIYSTVGKRTIIMTYDKQDQYAEEFNVTLDFIGIVYINLSEKDRAVYKKTLLEYGFVEEEMYISSEKEYEKLLFKNNIEDNSFYVVVIDDMAIIYSTGAGNYESVLN